MSASQIEPVPVNELRPSMMTVCDGHQKTSDGRIRHYMVRVDDHWLCMCGETRASRA